MIAYNDRLNVKHSLTKKAAPLGAAFSYQYLFADYLIRVTSPLYSIFLVSSVGPEI